MGHFAAGLHRAGSLLRTENACKPVHRASAYQYPGMPRYPHLLTNFTAAQLITLAWRASLDEAEVQEFWRRLKSAISVRVDLL
jgi:hypothetical protein